MSYNRLLFTAGVLLVALGMALPQKARAMCDEWTPKHTTLAVWSTVATVADWGQTLNIVRRHESGNYSITEANPLLGRNPTRGDVNKHFVRALVIQGLVACTLTGSHRTYYLTGVGAIQSAIVLRNNGLGLSISF